MKAKRVSITNSIHLSEIRQISTERGIFAFEMQPWKYWKQSIHSGYASTCNDEFTAVIVVRDIDDGAGGVAALPLVPGGHLRLTHKTARWSGLWLRRIIHTHPRNRVLRLKHPQNSFTTNDKVGGGVQLPNWMSRTNLLLMFRGHPFDEGLACDAYAPEFGFQPVYFGLDWLLGQERLQVLGVAGTWGNLLVVPDQLWILGCGTLVGAFVGDWQRRTDCTVVLLLRCSHCERHLDTIDRNLEHCSWY